MKFELLVSFLVTLFFSLTSNATALEPVRDIDGHVLIPGEEYYILPVSHGLGGGLTATQRNYEMCPLYVAQEKLDVDPGQPLKFYSKNPRNPFVYLSTDINIQFAIATTCIQGTTWQLGNADGSTDHRHYVILKGFNGNPGPETVNNWFKIEKYDEDYKLVFCPSVCETCKVECGDVGVFSEDGKRLLGLGGRPFRVNFRKLDPES